MSASNSPALNSPAAERNKAPILEVLRRVLPGRGTVLEVASGTGQHVVYFAAALPGLRWLPSDPEPAHRASITAHVIRAGLDNVAPPLALDVLEPHWGVGAVDAVVTANLLHIAPRAVLPALCRGSASLLAPGGILFVYGPFKRGGRHTSDGNRRFDATLRAQDPRWGLWDVEAVTEATAAAGLDPAETVEMPANNLSLVFRLGEPAGTGQGAPPGAAEPG